MTSEEIRQRAEADLEAFIRLVAPHRVLGGIHSEWCRWTQSSKAGNHQLTLLPRDHGKSWFMAAKVAWAITRNPSIRVLYVSSTSNLAEKQLGTIKDLITSEIYRRYWPEMVNKQEAQRSKWTNTEIQVDHPQRKLDGIRDPTVFCAGLTTNLVGMHCDVAVFDDIIVYDNAYTEEGRSRVRTQYSLFNSIEGTDAEEWVCGTRYHPKDLYAEMQDMAEEVYDDAGDIIDYKPIYTVFERQVENVGDGTGEFLWPKQQAPNGRWFGFDRAVLATKRNKYLDRTQFRAQYYNDPNDSGNLRIDRNKFQYYEPNLLSNESGTWYYKNSKLNVFASVDFAYTTNKRSDYTAIAVIGVDKGNSVYVLELTRFKTDSIPEYFQQILRLHKKWGFRKLGAEITAAQSIIVKELRDGYIRPYGLALSIEELKHSKAQGSKDERIAATLEPRYDNMAVWHYKGGECQNLEDELVSQHPPHDDCMDALSAAIAISVPPSGSHDKQRSGNVLPFHNRFGGIAA